MQIFRKNDVFLCAYLLVLFGKTNVCLLVFYCLYLTQKYVCRYSEICFYMILSKSPINNGYYSIVLYSCFLFQFFVNANANASGCKQLKSCRCASDSLAALRYRTECKCTYIHDRKRSIFDHPIVA
jgi:hypothetical protein